MCNQIKHIFIYLTLIFSISPVLAEGIDLKLDCRISLVSIYANGTQEKEQLSSIFTIYQSEKLFTIISDSEKFWSFSSKYASIVFSNKDKWRLAHENPENKYQILIDRNTGEILYEYFNLVPNGELLKQVEASGFCRKLEGAVKKLF